jgi:UDPglucose 6-dehydrogenase
VVINGEEAYLGAHAVAVLTEWDEFKDLDFQTIHDRMLKPAFLFDVHNILPHAMLREIGFRFFVIGKPY